MNSASDLAGDLRALGDVPVTTETDARIQCSADIYSRGTTCLAVVRPRTADELARAVRHLASAGYALLPRGGGLTYSGGYLSESEPGIVIDTSGLDRIVDLNPRDMYVTVEAGVTWRQIHEALRPHGLRLPCFGTFSGAAARVGGGLSSGALFFGTARYGTVADSLLGLEVALADGTLLRTGQAAFRGVRKPAYRTYGPDLTGPFVHDCGALGIKTKATFRVIRAPAATGYASYAFADVEAAAAALSEVACAELAEDAYVFDPPTTRNVFAGVDLRRAVRSLAGAAAGESSTLRGLAAAGRLALSGARGGAEADGYSLHVVAAARGAAGLKDDLAACDAIAERYGGRALPDSVPRGARANLFPPLNDVLGANGDRWVAINAKVAHSDAMAVHAAVDAIFARHAAALADAGVRTKRMFIALSNHSFSYEPAFMWSDEWLPLHRSSPEPRHLAKFPEPAANPRAHAAVTAARRDLVRAFAELGAASNQIGRLYPYADSLDPATKRLLLQLKRDLDPRDRMNPGVLGLAHAPTA